MEPKQRQNNADNFVAHLPKLGKPVNLEAIHNRKHQFRCTPCQFRQNHVRHSVRIIFRRIFQQLLEIFHHIAVNKFFLQKLDKLLFFIDIVHTAAKSLIFNHKSLNAIVIILFKIIFFIPIPKQLISNRQHSRRHSNTNAFLFKLSDNFT